MTYLFGAFSLAVFTLGLAIHVFTFVHSSIMSLDMAQNPSLPLMHFGALAAFGPMVVHLSLRKNLIAKPEPQSLMQRMENENSRSREVFGWIFSATPWPFIVLFVAVGIYVFMNFFICMGKLQEGQPQFGNGAPYLSDHGHYVRRLSIEQFRTMAAYETRLFSGHWIIFSLMPTMYFLIVCPRIQQMEWSLRGVRIVHREDHSESAAESRR